jgi:hypothetical protein
MTFSTNTLTSLKQLPDSPRRPNGSANFGPFQVGDMVL